MEPRVSDHRNVKLTGLFQGVVAYESLDIGLRFCLISIMELQRLTPMLKKFYSPKKSISRKNAVLPIKKALSLVLTRKAIMLQQLINPCLL